MPPHTTQPSFGPGPQDQLAPQAAPEPKPGRTTAALAERHEALWLSLSALHKDIVALGAKKPGAAVSEPVRIAAEGLLSDCAAFTRKRNERLPVAAPDLGGLAIQLGQALAALDAWESRHTSWDENWKCRVWLVTGRPLPIRRLKPNVAPPQPPTTYKGASIRDKLLERFEARRRGAYEDGFRDGLAARKGPPPEGQPQARQQTYPRLAGRD